MPTMRVMIVWELRGLAGEVGGETRERGELELEQLEGAHSDERTGERAEALDRAVRGLDGGVEHALGIGAAELGAFRVGRFLRKPRVPARTRQPWAG
jgi:hypothetical protein